MTTAVTWITGARGFIGRHLARHLEVAGDSVLGIGHGAWPGAESRPWGISHWVNGDITSDNLHILAGVSGKPQVIVHLAGGSSVGVAFEQPFEDFTRTVDTTARVLEWIRTYSPATIVVIASSAAAYGIGHAGSIGESAATRPFSPYGYHKLMTEMLCRSYGESFGVRSIIARLFSVYGCGLKKQLLWDLCVKLSRRGGGPIELGGTGEEIRDWVEIRDVVEVLKALPRWADPHAPHLNIARGVGVSVREIASLAVRAWGIDTSLDSILRFNGRSRPGDPTSLIGDVSLMKSRGMDCRISVSQAVPEYVAWFKSWSAQQDR